MFAPGMKTIEDALTVRRRVFGAFEMAESATSHTESQHWLTFVLVGAGPTGVELAGQIRELATKTLRAEYRHIDPRGRPGAAAGRRPRRRWPRSGLELSGKAAAALRKLGVELHMDSIVTKVDGYGVEARGEDGTTTRYDAGTVLWTAGVEAPPLAAVVAEATGASRDRAGRIIVGDDLTIPGHPEITVAGDLMSLHGLPGVAEVAMQSGLYVARRIKHEVAGQPERKPFRYHDLGSAAYISRGPRSCPPGGCTCPASSAGGAGCSFTLPS